MFVAGVLADSTCVVMFVPCTGSPRLSHRLPAPQQAFSMDTCLARGSAIIGTITGLFRPHTRKLINSIDVLHAHSISPDA